MLPNRILPVQASSKRPARSLPGVAEPICWPDELEKGQRTKQPVQQLPCLLARLTGSLANRMRLQRSSLPSCRTCCRHQRTSGRRPRPWPWRMHSTSCQGVRSVACSVRSCVMRGGGQAGRERVIVPNSLASGQTGMQSACGCISSMQVLVTGLAYIAHSRDQQTGRRDRHPNAPFHHARRPIVPCMCRSIRLNVSNQTQHGSPHRRSPVSSAPSDCRRLAALAAKRNSPPASCIQPLALAQALHGGTVNYKYWRRLQQISASAHVLHRVCS